MLEVYAPHRAALDQYRVANQGVHELEDMIAVHQRRLDEIEAREAARINGHVIGIEWLNAATVELQTQWMTLPACRIEEIEAAALRAQHRDWEEYAAASVTPLASVIEAVATARANRARYDAEQAELTALRQAAAERAAKDAQNLAEREQAERDERIRSEAAAAAVEVERKAAQKAIDDAQRAQAKAKADAAAAVEAEWPDWFAKRVHAEIADDITVALNLDYSTAIAIITAISEGKLRHVSITY